MIGNHKTPLQQVLETDVERESLLTEQEVLVNKVDDNDDENNARLSEINKRL